MSTNSQAIMAEPAPDARPSLVEQRRELLDILMPSYARLHSSERPRIPGEPAAARLMVPWFTQRSIDAYRRYESAKRAWQQARGELEILQAVGRGEYDGEPPTGDTA